MTEFQVGDRVLHVADGYDVGEVLDTREDGGGVSVKIHWASEATAWHAAAFLRVIRPADDDPHRLAGWLLS